MDYVDAIAIVNKQIGVCCCSVLYASMLSFTSRLFILLQPTLQHPVFLLYHYSIQYTLLTRLYPSIPLSLLLSQSVVVGRSRCNNCDTANAVTRTYYRSIQASQPDRHVPCLHASLTHVLSRLSTHIPTHTQTRRSPSACPASPVLLVLGGKVRCPCVCVLSAWLSWHTPGGLHSGGQTR
jgi:hypothetical protein